MPAEKITQSLWDKFTLLATCFLFLNINPISAQQNNSDLSKGGLDNQLKKAIEMNDDSRINSLVRDNRLKIKPFLLQLTEESLNADLDNNKEAAKKLLYDANKVATVFDKLFSEKCLVNIVKSYNSWDINAKRKKAKADSLNNMATSYRSDRNRHDDALNLYNSSLSIYKDIDDTYGQAIVYGGIGYIYWFYDTDSTLRYYNLALDAREQLDDWQLISASLNGIGLVYDRFLNNYEKAIEYYNRAEKYRREIEDWKSLGTTLSYKASALEYSGRLNEAIDTFHDSYEVNTKAGVKTRMAEARLHSGTLLNNLGSFDEALDDLYNAMEILEELNDSIGIGDVLTQLSSVYVNLGDYTSAIDACSESVKIMQELGDELGLAGAYNNMGWIYQGAKRLERSTDYYLLALQKFEELKDEQNIIITLNNLGTVYHDLGDFIKAEQFHKKGLEKSGEIDYTLMEMICLLNLANDQNKLGKLDEALSNYNLSLRLADTINSPEGKWKALVGIAENYKLKEDYEKSVNYNEQALSIVEDIRSNISRDEFKANYLARERYAFEDAVSLLGDLDDMNPGEGYDIKAFDLAEKCKARALLDLLAGQDIENINAGQQGKTTLDDFKNKCLDDKTCLVEYLTGDSCSWAWLVTQQDQYIFKLPPVDTIREQVELLRFALEQPANDNIGFFIESGCSLFEMLLGPLQDQITDFDNLIIIPDGVLNYLPFEVLLADNVNKHDKHTFSDLPYLTLKHSVSYAQSASVLYNILSTDSKSARDKQTLTELVAFGDPYYGKSEDSYTGLQKFTRLKYSAGEVEGIADLFAENRTKLFLREEAREENIKSDDILLNCRYLHLATHGIIDDRNPDLNSIVLAQDDYPDEDGYLRTSEIFGLKTNADLVVLSACETGMGRMIRGEGVIGLTRAFIYAGAPSVVVSLWSVSDVSTAELMQEFYRNMIIDGHPKSEALKKARIALISGEQFAHPFYWAPFILIGDRN